jgi:hypothetical protein
MHRTPSSLRGKLDTSNLRTNETNIMNQSMKLWDNADYTKNDNYSLLDGAER